VRILPGIRLLAAILVAATAASHLSARSLYVWSPASAMTDGVTENGITDYQAQDRLIRFCANPEAGITRLYFLVVPETMEPGSMATFLRRAKDAGIEVYAVPRGSIQDDWIAPMRRKQTANHAVVWDWAETILAFNREHPEGGFAGIQLDVEPHLAAPGGGRPLWKRKREGTADSKTNRRIALAYLDLLDGTRRLLEKGPGSLKLAVTIPTWYDGNDRPKTFRFTAGGHKKTWAAHIQDRVDFVSLMGYADAVTKEGRARLLNDTRQELKYGPAEILLESSKRGRKKKARTLYQEGEKAMLRLERFLAKAYRKQPHFLGTGVHHYLHAYGSGSRKWPRHEN